MAKLKKTWENPRTINPLLRLWPYNPNDESTWYWSDYKTKKVGDQVVISEWIKNPDFKFNYEH